MSNKETYLEKLKANREALALSTQQQQNSSPQVDTKAGDPVAPGQVPPKEDADEIERLRAENEALKLARQTGGNAAVIDDDQIEALPAERLDKYRDAFGDDIADLLAEDLATIRRDSKIKARELETKLKQSERFNEYVGKVEKSVLETFHSPEFQEFAKAQKLGRKLTLADELNDINTTNDVEGAKYLTEQVEAWQATQKVTRRASSTTSAPIQRFASAPVGVSHAELNVLKENVRRHRPGTPGFVEAKAAFDKARTQIIEGLSP